MVRSTRTTTFALRRRRTANRSSLARTAPATNASRRPSRASQRATTRAPRGRMDTDYLYLRLEWLPGSFRARSHARKLVTFGIAEGESHGDRAKVFGRRTVSGHERSLEHTCTNRPVSAQRGPASRRGVRRPIPGRGPTLVHTGAVVSMEMILPLARKGGGR